MSHVKIKLLNDEGVEIFSSIYHRGTFAHYHNAIGDLITSGGGEVAIWHDPPMRPEITSPEALKDWAVSRGAVKVLLVPSAQYPENLPAQLTALRAARDDGWPADPDAAPEPGPPMLLRQEEWESLALAERQRSRRPRDLLHRLVDYLLPV